MIRRPNGMYASFKSNYFINTNDKQNDANVSSEYSEHAPATNVRKKANKKCWMYVIGSLLLLCLLVIAIIYAMPGLISYSQSSAKSEVGASATATTTTSISYSTTSTTISRLSAQLSTVISTTTSSAAANASTTTSTIIISSSAYTTTTSATTTPTTTTTTLSTTTTTTTSSNVPFEILNKVIFKCF